MIKKPMFNMVAILHFESLKLPASVYISLTHRD